MSASTAEISAINNNNGTYPGDCPTSFPANQCRLSRTDFRSASGLFAIITGIEHSGTTVIASAPNLYGALECGLLLAPKRPSRFREVSPFYDWMILNRTAWWGLTREQRSLMTDKSKCFAEMYAKLRRYSPAYRHTPNTKSWVVDKTPAYVGRLVSVMDRTPGVPVVVTEKSERDQVRSLMKRGLAESKAKDRVADGKAGLRAALVKYPRRIHVVNTTMLYRDPSAVMERVFDFLGLRWKEEYLSMEVATAKHRMGRPDLNASFKVTPFNPAALNSMNETIRHAGS